MKEINKKDELILISGKYITKQKENCDLWRMEHGDEIRPFEFMQNVYVPKIGCRKASLKVTMDEYNLWLGTDGTFENRLKVEGKLQFPKSYKFENRGDNIYAIPTDELQGLVYLGYILKDEFIEGIWIESYTWELLLSN